MMIKGKYDKKKWIPVSVLLIAVLLLVWYIVKLYQGATSITESEQQMLEFISPLFNKKAVIDIVLKLGGLTVIPAIFTMCGTSFATIGTKRYDWKNRNAIKRVLVKKVTDSSEERLVKVISVFGVEAFGIIAALFVIYGFALLLMFFISQSSYGNSRGWIPVILLALAIMASSLYGSVKNCKVVKAVVFMLVVGLIGSVLLMAVIQISLESKKILFAWAMVSICFMGAMIYQLYKGGFYQDYRYVVTNICIIIRYTFLCGFIFHCLFVGIGQNVNLCLYLWFAFVAVEYLYIIYHDDTNIVAVYLINEAGQHIKTKGNMIQYEGNKIKYRLEDGQEELIDDSGIKEITYQRKTFSWERIRLSKKETTLYLKGVVHAFSYHDYKYLSERWVCFYKDEDDIRNVRIIKNDDIEKIIFTKK